MVEMSVFYSTIKNLNIILINQKRSLNGLLVLEDIDKYTKPTNKIKNGY